MSQLATANFAADPSAPRGLFTLPELRRVGIAATLIVVVGTIIILTLLLALGHYSSLSHCGPKAVWDGLVIALLLGTKGRWRCLALLGVVYGLVLLIQIGVVYLVLVMAVAGVAAAWVGWAGSWISRPAALFAAAACYELLSGFGAPVKIYFGTADANEPLLWGLWFAEWPLRIGGAMLGVWLGNRWMQRQEPNEGEKSAIDATPLCLAPPKTRAERSSHLAVAAKLSASILACIVPMLIQNVWILACIAGAYLIYALACGVHRGAFHACIGLIWTWAVFSLGSYLWHHDLHRVLDLGRTLVLRFTPLTLAAIVLVATVRPLDLLRFLRRIKLPAALLIPLSTVARNIPASRREFHVAMARMKQDGDWTGPLSLLRRPRRIATRLIGPTVRRWMRQLAQ